jgi:hypothetical protein
MAFLVAVGGSQLCAFQMGLVVVSYCPSGRELAVGSYVPF